MSESEVDLLKMNFNKPWKVCANPPIAVPTAAKVVWMRPIKMLRMCWKMARIPVKTEVMALMMEPTMPSAELVTDGILCGCVVRFSGVVLFERRRSEVNVRLCYLKMVVASGRLSWYEEDGRGERFRVLMVYRMLTLTRGSGKK